MATIVNFLKMLAVLGAAMLLGNWFLTEIKDARKQGKPWYVPYFSVPGILIILFLILPIIIWIIKSSEK